MDSTTCINLILLAGFSPEQRTELNQILEYCQYPAGHTILRQGQAVSNVYILLNGEVEILHRPYDGPVFSVCRLSVGGVFGWSAILGRDAYTSSVRVLSDCSTYSISKDKLGCFCEHHHETGVVLLEKMALSVSARPEQTLEQIMGLINHVVNCRVVDNNEER